LATAHFFWLGALAKMFATFITYPYIVVKSRLQMKQDSDNNYTSTTDALLKIAKHEGVQGFYKGNKQVLSTYLHKEFPHGSLPLF
jgi:adenine nucleotide transporter 17